MLERLRQAWRTLQGWMDGRRFRADLRRLAAVDPVKALLTELCVRADVHGLDGLTARQQLVVRAWSGRGVIGNGGFRHFLRGAMPLAPVADGFRQLGFPGAAAACERVMKAVAGAGALEERGRRAAFLQGAGADALDGEDSAVFDVEWDALEAAIGDFMRRHPRDFPGVAAPARSA